MKYGKLEAALQHEPVEVAVLVEDGRQSGPFVANHERRGVTLSDGKQLLRLASDEALALLTWLQEQESTLRALIDEESTALGLVEQRMRGGGMSTIQGEHAVER